jgi:hypothetical protein
MRNPPGGLRFVRNGDSAGRHRYRAAARSGRAFADGDERRTAMIIVIFHLAVEALETFGRLDLPAA